jgi:carbonic anhydrase/acetyltransferase-like protein (isoleucine patch superfamily)
MSDVSAFRGPPLVDPSAWVHPGASLCGTITLGPRVSIWGGAVLLGDTDQITIGAGSNIQDLTMVHTDAGVPLVVGERVTVGHRAILHGCHIEDAVLIGMGAILLNRCRIGTGSIIGAGALVPEGVEVPPNSLVLGMPGRVVRQTTEVERATLERSALHYQRQAVAHRDGAIRYHERG